MKHVFTRLPLIIIFFAGSYAVSGQKNFWTDVQQTAMGARLASATSLPKKYRTLRLDTTSLVSALRSAPREFTEAARSNPLVLAFPMADGSFRRFKVVQTSIMEPGLAARFPNIKTFNGQGIDDPYATIKIDWTEFGFHAMILSQVNGVVFIDPYDRETRVNYISYNKKDATQTTPFIESGVIANRTRLNRAPVSQRTAAASCIGGTLKQYRLAVACTAEYADSVGGHNVTTAQALSAIVTTVNRVDGVYETEVDIRMLLVNNNDKIVFTDYAKQPFKGNYDARKLINESQKVIDSIVGPANYDIGHTFSTGAGGYAGVGVVCLDGSKAQGVTGSPHPVGDPYDIDYVAHEMGHQFGANHTFNALTGSCGDEGQAYTATNAEPGSGVTIMGYAGICAASNDLEPHSIPYFHAVSLDEITSYINAGTGNSCAVPITTTNRPPVVNAGNDYVIPTSTPFVLSGAANDPDGDSLTYSWEEVNVGGPFGNWNNPSGDAPIFRSFAPVNIPVRYFPKQTDVINNTTVIGEILPSYGRTLQFRLTARDNRSGGSGVCSDEAAVTVVSAAGPFVVTAPNTNTSWEVGSFSTITWNVANSNAVPVNCTRVAIELSTDGGLTFPITLLSNTPNDGIEEVVVPDHITSAARIRVRAVGNIFYDISDLNFSIIATSQTGFTFSNPQPVISCNNSAAGTIIFTNSLNKFSSPITLSASGNPAGTSVVFTPATINPGSNDSITLKGNIPAGIYNVTITGTAGSVVKTRVVQFTIGLPTTAPVNSMPANNSIGNLLLPTFKWHATPDARSYALVISTSSTFATTVQSINNISDSVYTLTTPLADNSEYYWRVIPYNSCGAGPASATSLFKTVAIVCANPVYSKNVPLIIDVVPNTVTSTLNIPTGGAIQDIDVVGLKLKHSAAEEITISLVSPSGTPVLLLLDETCYGNQSFNVTFDDAAADYITCAPDTQVAKPLYPLSAFNNENSTGTWRLLVRDIYDGDGGMLNDWGLRICTYQPTALPVNWLSFTATKNENKTVVLQWSTANETNNRYYEIEKSSDGITFTSIGKIDAGKNYAALQQYFFNDVRPYSGNNYYRLKQVDKDGHFSYSSVAKVIFDGNADQYIVYPNPAIDKSTLRILSDMPQLNIRLADASGKTVYQRSMASAKAGETFEIPVKTFGKGLYILTLQTAKGTSNEKIIVQ